MFVGFVIYGNVLLAVGKFGDKIKYFIANLVYLLFAVLIVSPFAIFAFMEDWRLAFNNDNAYMVFFLLCYVFCLIPGGIFFKKKYIKNLQAIGFFKSSM